MLNKYKAKKVFDDSWVEFGLGEVSGDSAGRSLYVDGSEIHVETICRMVSDGRFEGDEIVYVKNGSDHKAFIEYDQKAFCFKLSLNITAFKDSVMIETSRLTGVNRFDDWNPPKKKRK